MDTPGEKELLRRIRAGDESAFQQLCRRYESRLSARISNRLSPAILRKTGASDVLQDAYLVAMQRVNEFHPEGDGAFGRWLGKIVEWKIRETVKRYARTEKRSVGREVSRPDRPGSLAFPGAGASPSQEAMAGELAAAARSAFARLPTDHRKVLELMQRDGLTSEEASRELGRTRGATQKLYERALARLASELGLEERR
jgi:RNA polymerase sigma-70 factor (ECF subfamily)